MKVEVEIRDQLSQKSGFATSALEKKLNPPSRPKTPSQNLWSPRGPVAANLYENWLSHSAKPGSAKTDDFAGGAQVDIQKAIDNNCYFARIFERLRSGIEYPDALVNAGLEGSASFSFTLTDRGEFATQGLAIRSQQEVLGLYLIATAATLFQEPLPKTCWLKDGGEQRIFANIRFRLHPEVKLPDESLYVGNKMLIDKSSLGRKSANDFIAHYRPPILPLPTGLYLDVFRLYEIVANYGEPNALDLSDRELKEFVEKLRRATKKSPN